MTFEVNEIDEKAGILTGRVPAREATGGIVPRYKAVAGHLSCDLNGEAVILNMTNGRYYGVNSVGASIWAAIQEPVSLEEVLSAVMNEYEVEESTCRRSVHSFLELMAKENLIEIVDE